MNGVDFKELYRETYSGLGFGLKDSDRISEEEIQAAEERLGAKAPSALHDYYLVAGREKKLNTAFNRLLSPVDWEVHEGKLVFMVENQCVVAWGTDVEDNNPDPKVYQSPTSKGKLTAWRDEGASCSAFLTFILHFQSAYGGGMPHLASTAGALNLKERLDAKWRFVGEIGGMRIYGGPGQAICFMIFSNSLIKTEGWELFAGALDRKSLENIARELEIEWDD